MNNFSLVEPAPNFAHLGFTNSILWGRHPCGENKPSFIETLLDHEYLCGGWLEEDGQTLKGVEC